MKILLSGANCLLGKCLVEKLFRDGHMLVIVGRETTNLARIFPEMRVYHYDDLDIAMADVNWVLHLDSKKETEGGLDSEYFDANVVLLQKVLDAAKAAKVKRFINFTSIHALSSFGTGAYLDSRRQGVEIVKSAEAREYENLFLPPVYGSEWSGRLGMLNKLPKPVSKILFPFMAALKPTVHVDKVLSAIVQKPKLAPDQDWILTDGQESNWTYRIFMRVVDLAFCASIVLLLFWALVIVWVSVRLTSPGPALFTQDRVGRDGKVFKCWKFRTMYLDTPQTGTHNVGKNSTTKIGRILRGTKIDELPQIKNILFGEMSLIGPRPCLPSQETLVSLRRDQGVLDVKPGISGLAQVRNVDMSMPQVLANLDERYVKTRGIVLDIKLILATALGKGQGDVIKAN